MSDLYKGMTLEKVTRAIEEVDRAHAGRVQARVYSAVDARGYTKRKDGTDWPKGVFIGRQVMKAVDEMGELTDCLLDRVHSKSQNLDYTVDEAIRKAASFAYWTFKDQDAEYPTSTPRYAYPVTNAREAISECADVVIPLLCLCEQLRRDFPDAGLPTLLDEVKRKSAADVARGVSQ